MIAKFRWHCISFFSIVRNVNHLKNSLQPRDTKIVINHRVGNFILNSMVSYLSIKSLHKQDIQKLHAYACFVLPFTKKLPLECCHLFCIHKKKFPVTKNEPILALWIEDICSCEPQVNYVT